MYLVVILTEIVPDIETAQAHFDIVKAKVADMPTVDCKGAFQDKLELT